LKYQNREVDKGGKKKMKKVGKYFGCIAGILSMLLWGVFCFITLSETNPDFEPIATSFVTLFLPACLATFASLTSVSYLMLVAFLWSLPISLYMAGTPSIFALFGLTCIVYFISFFLQIFTKFRMVLRDKLI
jgi:hypothetical protein